MHRPIGTGGDPGADLGNLLRRDASTFRRHPFAFFGGENADEEFAVVGFPRYERRRAGGEGSDGGIAVGQSKVGFSLTAAVTLEAMLGKNRLNIRFKARGNLVRSEGRTRDKKHRKNQPGESRWR